MEHLQRILIIEDDPVSGDLFRTMLKAAEAVFHGSVEVFLVTGWDEGKAVVEKGGVDVVLLDLSLPPRTRDDTIAEAAAVMDDWPATVVVTGTAQDETRRQCIAIGAQDFLLKDWVPETPPKVLMQTCYNAFLRKLKHPKTYVTS